LAGIASWVGLKRSSPAFTSTAKSSQAEEPERENAEIVQQIAIDSAGAVQRQPVSPKTRERFEYAEDVLAKLKKGKR
jgi:hypothetical protein